MHFKALIPVYNSELKVKKTISSVASQNHDDFSCDILDDCSDDGTWSQINHYIKPFDRFNLYKNEERYWALRNIVEWCHHLKRTHDEDMVIGILDGDDYLTDNSAITKIMRCYEREGCDVLWTNYHTPFAPASGFSKFIPSGVDVYRFPWSSSHLKTFKLSALAKINIDNFKDESGDYFKRCYDQALMLPLLHSTQNWYFLDQRMYYYGVNPETTFNTIELQAQIEHKIRTRGYLENANV